MYGMTLVPLTAGAPLLDLPNELLDHIVSYLGRPDLLTLRLVSQAIHNRTSSHTCQTCYSVARTALWLPESLSRAHALLSHKRLNTWVERIRIHVDRPTLADRDNIRHCEEGCPNDAEASATSMPVSWTGWHKRMGAKVLSLRCLLESSRCMPLSARNATRTLGSRL